MCLPAQAIGLAGRGAWSRGKVTRRGRGLTRPMEKPIHRWKRPSLMEEPLTNRRDADIDKRGAVKRRRVHTKPSMLATRPKLGNGNLQELNDEAKATRPPLCFCLALDRSRPSQPAADGASSQFLRLLSSRPTAAPWLLLSVCVRWGGDPSSVVNIYNPNYSSHPTQQQRHAVGRHRVVATSELSFLSPRLPKTSE